MTPYDVMHSSEFINHMSNTSILYGIGCIAFCVMFVYGVVQVVRGTKAGIILVACSALGFTLTYLGATFFNAFAGTLSGG